MTVASTRFRGLEIPPAQPRQPFRPRATWAALRALLANPARTEGVFELMAALGGPDGEPWFQGFVQHPDGQRLLAAAPELGAILGDRAALAAMPEGSLGRAYLAHLDRFGLDPRGVIEAQRRNADKNGGVRDDPARRWYFDRVALLHDLWHTLTGYGADEMGEGAVLAFSLAQQPSRGFVVLVLAAALMGPKRGGLAWQRYLARAWWRGRRARQLDVVAWEDLLPRPLHEVRAALAIEAPERAHPRGIRQGSLFTRSAPGAAAVA